MLASRKLVVFAIGILLAAGGYFLYGHYGSVERSGQTIDRLYHYVEQPREDGCITIFLYSVASVDPISKFVACDDRTKKIEYKEGLLTLTTKCGRRYTADLDKHRDFYDNNYCDTGSFEGGLFSKRVTIDDVYTYWEAFEPFISVRPSIGGAKAWGLPTALQFIGKNALLARVEDGHFVHMLVVKFDENRFVEMQVFEGKSFFSLDAWVEIAGRYGDPTEQIDIYTRDLIREGEVLRFDTLTHVPENVFLEQYYIQ